MYWQITNQRHPIRSNNRKELFQIKLKTDTFHFTIKIILQGITNIYHIFCPKKVWALPSTLVIKLQDRFKVRSEDREANPSIRQMWLDDRSRCFMCHAVVKPSILVRRLQWRFRDEILGFRGTSSRLKMNFFSEVTITHCTGTSAVELDYGLNWPWNILIN